jgi:transposase
MSDGMVRKWVRKFNECRDNVHDEPRSDRPSVVSDELVAATFCEEGIQKLVPRYDKCLKSGGNYVEK